MTFVITNGRYMIADKRSTISKLVDVKESGDEKPPSRRTRNWINDESEKIIRPKNVKYNDKKVLCMSGAGDVEGLKTAYKLAEKFDMKLYYRALDRTKGASAVDIVILLVLEDFSSARIDVDVRNGISCVTIEEFGTGTTVAAGSGGQVIDFYDKNYKWNPDGLHMVEVFFFGVAGDKGSSFNYDAYDAETKKYVINCTPTEEAVRDTVKKLQSTINFFPDKKGQVWPK